MKKILVLLLISCVCHFGLSAQDTYHTTLQSSLQNDYGLSNGDWIFFDSESSIYSDANSWGLQRNLLDAEGTDFSKILELRVSNASSAPWNAGWQITNNVNVISDDVVLCVFSLRSINGAGKVNFFVENVDDFSKEIILTLPVGEEWQQYYIPFKSTDDYNINKLSFGFHAAHQVQTIQVGGFTAINYNNSTNLENLPIAINNDKYDGYEIDAPWRVAAAQRIDELRKTDLTINVKNSAGDAIESAGVNVKMLRHEYAFGTAITANRIAGNNAQNNFYQNKLTNLDGQGHGFNWIVFENDMKWPAWEDNWFVSNAELANAVQWLRQRDIEIRGHTLVWPGFNNLPSEINANTPLNEIKSRINNHIEEIINYPGIQGEIAEWDVLNEVVTNRSLQDVFKGTVGYPKGRELYQEIFNKAREVDANTGLWLNDFITISNGVSSGGNYDALKLYVGELVDSGVDIEGLGFQSHIGGFPNGIPSVLATLDDFSNNFGIKTKVTEFDLPSIVSEELGAQYLRDYLTATFSHPSMNGFFFWSFWDGATYMNPGANLFDMNWSRTPAGDAFVDLVFNEWWTDETIASAADGIAQSRIFKGTYEISYECDGVMVRDTIEIAGNKTIDIVCDNFATNTSSLAEVGVSVFPNPSVDQLTIELGNNKVTRIRLIDMSSKEILKQQVNDDIIRLDVSELKGVYLLEVELEEKSYFEKIIIQ